MTELTEKLRNFNTWRDDFLIEASTLLLMLGFIMGTVDLFFRGAMATAAWFSLSWAIVQAIAIDGLFFAVWGKVARSRWLPGQKRHMIAMIAVGIILAIVAVAVNGILSYQQITGIADSLVAMQSLGINSIAFVIIRAILVVAVALLVQLFCRGATVEISPVAIAVAHEDNPPVAIVAIEEEATIAIAQESVARDESPTSAREKVRATWLRFKEEGRDIKLQDIAKEAELGYSTVKKWAREIKKEIA